MGMQHLKYFNYSVSYDRYHILVRF